MTAFLYITGSTHGDYLEQLAVDHNNDLDDEYMTDEEFIYMEAMARAESEIERMMEAMPDLNVLN